jgi:4'-phosphopantetheinyl transferase
MVDINMNSRLSLKPTEIHAWMFDLDSQHQVSLNWEKLLSEQESERAKGYRFEQGRLRFVTRRGILRLLLGEYTGMEPARIVFQTNPYGKLSLGSNPLKFNLSSRQNRAVYVIALGMEMGVDIERVRPLEEGERIVENWFSPDEQAGFATLTPEMQIDAFFHIWTQKEAFIKAHGEGMSLPLQAFSVCVDPNRPGKVLSIKKGGEQPAAWQMYTYAQFEGWRVAICAQTKTGAEIRWQEPKLAEFISNVTSRKTSPSV